MTNTNHTAAQPLDLDNRDADIFSAADLDEIEAIAAAAPKCWYGTYQIVDGISDEKAVALIEACSPDTVLTLIAQARAAQPESATLASQEDITGTTGAIIGPDEMADMIPQGAVVQQDGDVRRVCMTYAELKQFAQLVAKGHDSALDRELLALAKNCDERLESLAAPASAQPADPRLEVFIDWYLREGKRSEIHPNGHVERTTRAHVLAWLDAMASAQIDRGAAPYSDAIGKAGENYHAQFEYAHPLPVQWRWADLWHAMCAAAKAPAEQAVGTLGEREKFDACIARADRPGAAIIAEATRAAASPASTPEASPASQPVAPVLTKEQIEDIIQAIKTSMNFGSGFFFPRGWNVLLDTLNAMLATPSAVAPSDAKGKADDAATPAQKENPQ